MQQHELEESQYATEMAAYNTESQAFSTELREFHNEQTQYNTVLAELRSFQKAFRTDRIDQSDWEKIKSWNNWVGHYQSEQSQELRKRYKQWAPSQKRTPVNTTHYACWHCGFQTYLSNQCMNYKRSENRLLQKEQEEQKKETEELRQKLLEAEEQLKKASHSSTNTYRRSACSSRENQSEARERLPRVAAREKTLAHRSYTVQQTDCGVRGQHGRSEKEDRAMEAIADQNHFAQKMVARKQRQELETAASQIGSLKQMHMDNVTINKNKDSEMATLRQQLQALEEKMEQLGIEKDKEEDKKDLEEAIAM